MQLPPLSVMVKDYSQMPTVLWIKFPVYKVMIIRQIVSHGEI